MKTLGGMKWCPTCKQFLDPDTDFQKDRARPDQLHAQCKKCRQKYYKQQKTNIETVFYVNSEYPSRGSVPWKQREVFDQLHLAGVAITIVTPSGQSKEWGELD